MRLYRLLYETATPEATKDDPYGEYLFGADRANMGENIPQEPNTEAEDKLKAALKAFFEHNKTEKLKELAPKILDLLAQHKYVPLLDPGHSKVYRGIQASKSFLKTLIGANAEIKTNEYVVVNQQQQSAPIKDRLVQSWSFSSTLAANFASESPFGGGGGVTILFVATTKEKGNNFFVNPHREPLPVVQIINTGTDREFECVSVGPVTIDGFVYFVPEVGDLPDAQQLAAAVEKI